MSQFSLKAAKAKLVKKQNLLKKAKQNLRKAEQEVKSAALEYELQVKIQRAKEIQGTNGIQRSPETKAIQGTQTIQGPKGTIRASRYLNIIKIKKTQRRKRRGLQIWLI